MWDIAFGITATMSMASRVGARTVLARPHQQDASSLRRASTAKGVQSKSGLMVHASYSASELSPRFSTRPYTVREGDTLFQIAKKRGTLNTVSYSMLDGREYKRALLHHGRRHTLGVQLERRSNQRYE